MPPSVLVHGPASWNRIVLLDRLPAPVPHTVFADRSWETVGGTSAGKALGLATLGCDTVLATRLGVDDDGERVRYLLDRAGVRLRVTPSAATEKHLNLMTPRGERLSIYLAPPADGEDPADPRGDAALQSVMATADALVLDLSAASRRLLPLARSTGRPLWVDLHDYDGTAVFHQPFLEAADAVFLNADATDDPEALARRCLRFGASFAVCTLGAEGALAVDAAGGAHRVAAAPTEVVDTNGAGDAFFAGVLQAHLAGAGLPEALEAGAAHAALVLRSRHLHPVLDALLDPL
ncbi:carbohydrate kinase family protein [Nocardioides jiangxiensis]|uniref:Carbohydrate kinase family protein n=1 Tax=Nocardioides jiangxiensis TaxID=3064524 RepID=A0ABT9B204_9ACTN|nr:carbohydrate kinase family protein [Nocardioides sp. WY-20]MDO7868869.1 carbohydrate kinase family protein [Nocardioides sp. WY-20]